VIQAGEGCCKISITVGRYNAGPCLKKGISIKYDLNQILASGVPASGCAGYGCCISDIAQIIQSAPVPVWAGTVIL
jgi:hypothetical protein